MKGNIYVYVFKKLPGAMNIILKGIKTRVVFDEQHLLDYISMLPTVTVLEEYSQVFLRG